MSDRILGARVDHTTGIITHGLFDPGVFRSVTPEDEPDITGTESCLFFEFTIGRFFQ